MRFIYIVLILVFFQNCSFDNKSGIWKSENINKKVDIDIFDKLETLSTTNISFNKIIPIKENFKFKLTKEIDNFNWNDYFYNQTNNFENFKYNNLNQLIFKSKKISKHESSKYILYDEGNVILSDKKGNIIIFSINENKVIRKLNFYKKKYKKINKILYLIVENSIIYVTDNIGFIYAYDYVKDNILWAKNLKVPFRSNLKVFDNKLVAANQNNKLFFFNKKSGDVFRYIPTEETIVKNKFINNFSVSSRHLFFLNTYGSLYSIEKKNMKINWFINLNQSIDLNPNNLFTSNQIINYKNKLIVPTNEFLYVIDANNGSIIYKKNFTLLIKPIIIDGYLFLITNNNLLIALELNSGELIYSYDLNQKIADFLNTKKKTAEFKNITIVNNKITIFLKNSYVLKFNIYGELEEIDKLPTKLKSHPIFIDKSILYLDFKNKLAVVD
jgi:hypothetical protein